MASFYYGPQQHQQHHPSAPATSSASHNHHGRSRRAPRPTAAQHAHRQFRGVRSMKELTEAPAMSATRRAFELARSFDPEDDLEFCRGLWTEDDFNDYSSSDGSLSSGSPNLSPVQPLVQPSQSAQPTFSLASTTENTYNPITGFQSNSNTMKLHQPSALRTRNAIPIVNPSTGMRVPSPPSSISPAMMQQGYGGRHW